jgi:16S rRNA (cytosine967-C5)-methyltransferase
MNAREVALHVVRDVFPSNGRARGAQEALAYRARQAGLEGRDRAFATELAYGAIKMRRALDWYLRPFVGDREATLHPTAHEILRLATFELRYTRAHEHATVYEFVELAKRHGHRGLASLVNAVLRSQLRNPPPPIARESFEDDHEYLATLHSLPTWLVRQWGTVFGERRLEAICAGVNEPPQTAVTVNLLAATRDAIAQSFLAREIPSSPSPYAPESLVLACDAAAPESAQDERWWLQSESSALAAVVLNPQPGEDVADLCSGRGNKALQIGARMENQGRVVCVDRDERRTQVLQSRAQRAGIALRAIVGDARETPGERFDRALLDAPCSGTGVVGRHPEARWRKDPSDGERLAALQRELIASVEQRLHDGGALVYAVCSTDPREGVEVVERFLERAKFARGLVPATLEPFLTVAGDVLVPPGVDGRDGFYIARLERCT